MMSGSGHSGINKNMMGLTSASPPINIPSKLASGPRSSVDSGVGTSTPDISIDAGSASSSPFRSFGTQTPARSLFDMTFALQPSWELDLLPSSFTANHDTDTDPMLVFHGNLRAVSLPATPMTDSELEAAKAAGRDLRLIADDYAKNEAVRRRTMELARRKSLLERLLRL